MSEAELQKVVLRLADLLGWLSYHQRPGRTLKGWRTAVQGGGVGWPDLVLLHPETGRLKFRELKSERGRLAPAQRRWLLALGAAGQDVGIWTPKCWQSGKIERELR